MNKAWRIKIAILLVICVGFIQIGAIRKKDDPIRNTQTGPIAYKKKMEEIKDGVKGAPSPSMQFYGHEKFMVTPPYEEEGDEAIPDYEMADTDELLGGDTRYPKDTEQKYWWKGEEDSHDEGEERVESIEETDPEDEESSSYWGDE